MKTITRHISNIIEKRIKNRNIISVIGARQTGKTTLCRDILPENLGLDYRYFLFDDPDERNRFKHNGIKILENTDADIIILDEVQKIPEIFEYIKYVSDTEDKKKIYLLTGSSQLLLLKNIRESLAGRISIFPLFPFSLFELSENDKPILSNLMKERDINNINDRFYGYSSEKIRRLINISELLRKFGGFPPVWKIKNTDEKMAWLKDYKKTYLEKDLTDIGGFSDIDSFASVHKMLSTRNSQLLILSNIAKDVGLSVNTVKKYLNILKLTFQCFALEPFSENIKKRMVKSPKIYFTDIGILKAVLGEEAVSSGTLYESHVFSELLKWKENSEEEYELFFYRTSAGMEIDFLIKKGDFILPIEVKTTMNPNKSDARNIYRFMKEHAPKNTEFGLIIYPGKNIVEIKKNIYAIPDWFIFS